MTRTEFDQKVREMKTQMANVIRPIQVAQAEIKEEIASKYRQINEIQKEISKLNQAKQGYHQQRIALEAEWRKKINDFIKENEPSTTSNLAEANTLNIVNELRRRGFDVSLTKVNTETGELEQYDLNKTDWTTTCSGAVTTDARTAERPRRTATRCASTRRPSCSKQ